MLHTYISYGYTTLSCCFFFNCNVQLKKVDETRLAYDARTSSYKSACEKSSPKQDEIDNLKQKASLAEQEYQQALKDFSQGAEQLEQRKALLLQTQLPGFVTNHDSYFNKGAEAANRFNNKTSGSSRPEEGKSMQ